MADISIEFLCNSLQEKAFIISQQMRAHHRSLQESSLRYWRKAMVVAYEKTQSLTWYASSSKTKWHEKPSTRSDRIKRFATGRLLRRVLNSTIRRSLVSTPKVMGHDMDKNNWYSDRFPNGGKLNKPSFFGVAKKKRVYFVACQAQTAGKKTGSNGQFFLTWCWKVASQGCWETEERCKSMQTIMVLHWEG